MSCCCDRCCLVFGARDKERFLNYYYHVLLCVYVSVCSMCVYMCPQYICECVSTYVCTFVLTHMKSEVNVPCLPPFLSTLLFETRSLTELGARQLLKLAAQHASQCRDCKPCQHA